MNYVSKSASAEAENTAFADLLHQFQVIETQLAQLTQEIDQRLQREQELYNYIRLKTNTMLEVIGTQPLAAEELDNQSLLSFDPIGIVTDSFRQVLNNLKETNAELTLAKEEIQAVFNASGAGIMVVDATFHLRACNHRGKELFFPGTTDVVGKNFKDLIWTSQQSQSECILDRVVQVGDITEESDVATKTLYRLREMGLTLAIDDFGTGYSSLSYLHHFPIQRLKVDKTFVRRLSTHPEDSAITEAIIVMAHTMGIKVVAEGIENKQELDFLTAKKCDEAQGFYFSRPLTIAQLTEKISAGVSAQSFCFFAAGSQ